MNGRSVIHVASGREWRGGQRQVSYLARALLSAPELNQVVVTGRGSRLAAELTQHGVRVSLAAWRPAFDPSALAHLFGAMTRREHGLPILHAHDSHALTLAALAAAWFRIPLIVTRRVDFPIRHPWLWRRADRVVCISEAVQRVVRASGIDARKTVVVPSGVDLAETAAVAPRDLRTELGLAANTKLAVDVAALVGHKDHRTLIEAAALLRERRPELHWVLVGSGPLEATLRGQILERRVTDVVHLTGEVPDGRAAIKDADLFVMSSREEGLNTSVLDAIALGVPVVCTDAGGLPEIVRGGAGLLVPKENPAALAEAVERVLGSPTLRASLIHEGTARARQFSHITMAAGIHAVYHSVS